MQDLPETLSFQSYSPDHIGGFPLFDFAYQSLDNFSKSIPVIMQVDIRSEEIFEKYKKNIWVILKRGHETDIHSTATLTTLNAFPISAEGFSFDEFSQYEGEVLIAKTVMESKEALNDLQLTCYGLEGNYYQKFAEKYREGTLKPPVLTIADLSDVVEKGNLEGHTGSFWK